MSKQDSSNDYENDVFISYKQTDSEDLALAIYETLTHKYRLKCFLDKNCEELDSLESTVKKSKNLLWLMSSNIFESDWCLRELQWAGEAKINRILISVPGATFGDEKRSFPDLEKDCPEKYRKQIASAFDSVAIPYPRNYYEEFIRKVLKRMGIKPTEHNLPGQVQNYRDLPYLKELLERIQNKQYFAIVGVPGSGKTELAKAYARHQLKKLRFCGFIDASSEDSIREGHKEIAKILGLDNGREDETLKEIVMKVNRELAKYQPWLMIFDNAQHSILEDNIFFNFPGSDPKQNKNLITSKENKILHETESIMNLNEGLSEGDAKTFFLKLSEYEIIDEQDGIDLDKTMKLLDRLPLQLETFAMVIKIRNQDLLRMNRGRSSLGVFLEEFEERRTKLENECMRERKTIDTQYKDTQLVALEMYLKELESKHPELLEVLFPCAFIGNRHIPLSLLWKYYKKRNLGQLLEEDFELARMFDVATIISNDSCRDTYFVHQTTQYAIQRYIEKNPQKLQKIQEDLIECMKTEHRPNYYCYFGLFLHMIQLHSYLQKKNMEERHRTLLFYLPPAYNFVCRYDDAIICAKQSLQVCQMEDRALCYENIAFSYRGKGNYSEALRNDQEALRIRENLFSSQHSEIAVSKERIGSDYLYLREGNLAAEYYGSALKIRERMNSNTTRSEIIETMLGLAAAHKQGKKYYTALRYLKLAKKKCREIDDNTSHPLKARTFCSLAQIYSLLKQNCSAEKYACKAFMMGAQLYSRKTHHASILTTYAMCLKEGGKKDEAYEKALEALKMREEIYQNGDHFKLVRSLNLVADCCSSLRESLEYYKKAEEMMKNLNDVEKNSYHSICLKKCASCLEKLNKLEDALTYYEKLFELNKRLFEQTQNPKLGKHMSWSKKKVAELRRRISKNRSRNQKQSILILTLE